jgi:hypothetical protein
MELSDKKKEFSSGVSQLVGAREGKACALDGFLPREAKLTVFPCNRGYLLAKRRELVPRPGAKRNGTTNGVSA